MRTRSILLLTAILCCSAWGQTYTISTLAGTGMPVNVPGTSASLGYGSGLNKTPQYIAADAAGNVFFPYGNTVLRLDATTGMLTLAAGNGTAGFSGDNGPATSAQLWGPKGVAVDSAGNLYIADTQNERIRKVSNGVITTLAGNGTYGFGGDNGPATSAQLNDPSGIAVDSAGTLYVCESIVYQRIRKVSNGVITTVVGGGSSSGDNGPAISAQLNQPAAVAVDSAGNLYIADTFNNRILKVSGGVITTVAGNGTPVSSGDNGPATSAGSGHPNSLAVDSAGNLYIAASGNSIRKVSGGFITTVAGGGGTLGDGGPATSAQLMCTCGVAVDATGNLYIADQFNARIRKVSGGVITTVAGNGTPGLGGDNGPATNAQLYSPEGVAVDSAGNLYIADANNHRTREVSGGVITTVAGGGSSLLGDPVPAASAQLYSPAGVAADSAGNLYIADSGNSRIRKVSGGVITTVAGSGAALDGGFSGDNGPATSAQLSNPAGVAVDAAGNLYIADSSNDRIRKVANGVITTVVGTGTLGFGGDNGPATNAELSGPNGVAVDPAGNLYIADTGNNRIRKVTNGVITTVAGNGTAGLSGDNGPATNAQLDRPNGVAVDSAGNLYIADTYNSRVRKVSNGVITTAAGGGPSLGDNGPAASAQVLYPYGVAVDAAGNLYIADTGHNRIRKVSNGVITTMAGNGTCCFSGDNGPANGAQLYGPEGVAVDSAGNLYIADSLSHRIRKVSNGVITTVAGNGTGGFSGDNGPGTSAELSYPAGVAVDSAGNLYIADTFNNRIRKVSGGVITTVAGIGTCCFSGDDGPATSAQLANPGGVAVDSAGNLYITDPWNYRVRRVSNGVITTVAGNGVVGFSGDNGPATSARLTDPEGIAVDSAGNLYIAGSVGSRIRKVSNGVISTVAGTGTYGFSGDNGPATSAQLSYPHGVAVDSAGNLYIGDTANESIRKISNGVISTVAGNGTSGFSGDNGPATSAQLSTPEGVAVNGAGNVYIADGSNYRIRVLTPAAVTGRTPTIMSVVNAASYIGGPISPGEVVTIFGSGIGPDTAAYAATDPATGKLATMIGGVQVLFSGIAAPMIYASGTQVSAVAPYEIPSAYPSVRVEYAGETSNTDQLTVAVTTPGLFAQNSSGSGPGAILNQDNSLNGPGHAAAKGSIVQVFMTGEGQTNPQGVTGAITTANLPPPQVTPAPVQPIQVWINGQPANYTYAGEAPGMVAGVMQLNVQIPPTAPSGALSIQVSAGGNMSQTGITVSVQ